MPTVKFRIEGDAKQAVAALNDFKRKLDEIAGHRGLRDVASAFTSIAASLRAAGGGSVRLNNDLRQIHNQTLKIQNTLKQQLTIHQRIDQSQRAVVRNTINMGRGLQEARRHAISLQNVINGIGRGLGIAGTSFTAAASRAVSGIRGSVGSGVGGIQSMGIGVRMSGIAMGNQLAQIFSGPLSGNIFSGLLTGLKNAINTGAGLISIGAQMATRIVTGIMGTFTKMAGPLVGGLVNFLVGGVGGALALGTKGVTKVLGGIMWQGANMVQGLLSGVTQFAGEIVVQVGNVFTGLTEVMRGAFQAAVNVAAGLLNTLASIAQGVVEKIAGAFGKIAGVVGAVGGTLAGLSLADRVKSSAPATSAALLFNTDISQDRRKTFRRGVQDLAFAFPTLDPASIGKAAEMVVSTGFQHSPEDALEFLRGILPLAEIADLQEIPELARAAAKVKDLFADEVGKQGGARSQGEFIAGRLFQVRNIGDLEIRDMANRLGEAAGLGKVFGQTLDEVLEQLALLSRGLNPEETFTAFRSLVSRLQRPAKETREMFDAVGISLKELTPEQEKQVDALRKQAELAERQAEALKGKKGTAKQASALKQAAKDAREEIDRIMLEAPSRKALDVVRDATKAFNKGVTPTGRPFSEEMFASLFPNLRGLKGAAAEAVLGPEIAAQVQRIFAESPQETLQGAQGQKRDSLSFSVQSMFKSAKQPFDAFWASVEDGLGRFAERFAGTMGRLSDFVKAVMADSGAAEFGQKLMDVIAPATEAIAGAFERLLAMSPGDFWQSMSNGLDAVVKFGGQVVTFFTTLGNLIGQLVSNSPALIEVGKALAGVAEGAGSIISDLSKGDTGSLEGLFSGLIGGMSDVWESVKTGFADLLGELALFVSAAGDQITSLLSEIWDKFVGITAGLFGFAGTAGAISSLGTAAATRTAMTGALAQQAAILSSVSFGGAGGGMTVTGGAPGAPGLPGGTTPLLLGSGAAATGGRLARGGGLLGRAGAGMRVAGGALGRIAAPFVAFDLGQQIFSGGSGSRATAFDTGLNIGGGAMAGGTIGSMIAPGVGTLVGAIIGGVVGGIASLFNFSAAADEAEAAALAEARAAMRQRSAEMLAAARQGYVLEPDTGFAGVAAEGFGPLKPRRAAPGTAGDIELLEARIAAQEPLAKEGNVLAEMALDILREQLKTAKDRLKAEEDARAAFGLKQGNLGMTAERALKGAESYSLLDEAKRAVLAAGATELTALMAAFPGAEDPVAALDEILRRDELLRAALDQARQEQNSEWQKQADEASKRLDALQEANRIAIRQLELFMRFSDQGFPISMEQAGEAAQGKRVTLADGTVLGADGEVLVSGKDVAAKKAALVKRTQDAAAAAKEQARIADTPLDPENPDFAKNVLLAKAKMRRDVEQRQKYGAANQSSLMKHDSLGRPYYDTPSGRKYVTTYSGGVGMAGVGFSRQSMGRRLGGADGEDDTPTMGAFGFVSGRAMKKHGRSGFAGFSNHQAILDQRRMARDRALTIAEAGTTAAESGNMAGVQEAAANLKSAAAEQGQKGKKDKALLDAIDSFIKAAQTAQKESDAATQSFADATANAVGEVKQEQEDFKARIKALEDLMQKNTAGGQ